ncbi:MAG: helix-turn-helix domain-containing protein [Saccharofermentanales bacterium]
MNNIFLKQKTPQEITFSIARRMRVIRKRFKLSQIRLSEKSGVSLGSLKRFENTGEISLISMTKLAIILHCESELDNLFTELPFTSIQEIIDGQN